MTPPEICPNCGVAVPRNAKTCPGCGADESTGWAEEARQATAADLGLPEEDFNYDEFVQREFAKPSPKPQGIHWFWWVVAIGLLMAILFTFVL